MRTTLQAFLKPTRLKLALLLPGVAFLLLELILEMDDVIAALPGLLIWAVAYYAVASLAVALRERGLTPPGFRVLVGCALLLAAVDQAAKGVVLQQLPLEEERTLIPGALILTHTHNLRGSWAAEAFGLDFLGSTLLIALALVVFVLTLSLYRYYTALRGQRELWPSVVLVGFVAAMSSALVDLAIRGFTVDYLNVAGLVVADLKDFYLDMAIAALMAEVAEEFAAARGISNRQLLAHLGGAFRLSAREMKATFRNRRSGPVR